MKRKALLYIPLVLAAILTLAHVSYAQLVAGPGVTDATSSQTLSNRTFSFSGTIPGQLDGAVTVAFSIYPDQQSASALWTETQVVQVTGEKYSVMLGSTSATGLPPDIFSADQAHWLGVQVNGSEKRFLLVSVPYAMKAVEAERLGGLLPSDYVTVQQLQSALQGAAGSTASAPTKTTTSGPTGQAAAAGTPPQPATDFTDNNGTEVLLVTQQGPGYAIHAISNLQPAIYAENNALSGTALQVVETSTDGGASTGLFAQTLGSGSIAGVFDSAGPAILELRKSGTRMVFFDQFGNMTANGEVRASDFAGSGSGLTNIPNAATTATSFNSSNTIVARDFNGGFIAGTIQATSFVGSGFGLTDIPPSAINATSINIANSVVARDGTGSFNANQVFANNFSGSGAGLFNIPPSAVNATSINIANSVVARDGTGSFNANQIFANNFSGSGSGLFNIPPSAVNATSINIANSVVARDGTGSFNANQIFANNFSGSGAGLFNIPPSAVNATSINIANSVVARDGTGSFNANQIFANNFSGSGAGLFNIPPSAVNATSIDIANSVVARDASGAFSAASINVNNLSANAVSGTAIQGLAAGNAVGIQASTQNGFGLWAGATANDSTGTALLLSHSSQGKLIDGGVSLGAGTDIFETFSVGAGGDVTFNGAMMTPYETTGTWFASSLVKLTSIPGNFGAGTVAMTSPGDTSGVIGIISGLPASGSRIQVVQSGEFFCNFDGPATSGHYVGISKTTAGDCADIGASFPADGQQVVGRVLSSFAPGSGRILLFQSELHGGGGSPATINTGAGLTGGPITGSGTISIANGGVTNTMLQNSSVTVTPGAGLTGGGAVSLGGTITLSNAGALSFNGRTGSITANAGDYSFTQISGSAAASQLPSTVVYNNQANSFTGNQTVSGAVSATSFSGSGSALTGINAAALNGLASGSFAQLAAANSFTAKQTLAASTTTSASLNVPGGTAPATPAAGDVWNTGSTLQYRDNASTTRSLVSTTQSGGLQMLKLTASITPSSVASQACAEQSFSVTGVSTGDVLLGVSQPSTSSPGTNIAIGGFRVSANNTVAVQFCNVSRNNSTPTAGVYTFAFMR